MDSGKDILDEFINQKDENLQEDGTMKVPER